MTEFLVMITPVEPENGTGNIAIYVWDDKRSIPTDEVLSKEYNIGMQTDGHSIMAEGKIYFKKHKEEFIKELEEEGYEDITFSMGI